MEVAQKKIKIIILQSMLCTIVESTKKDEDTDERKKKHAFKNDCCKNEDETKILYDVYTQKR